MGKIAYLLERGEPMQGSRYKYFELLKMCGYEVKVFRNTLAGIVGLKRYKPMVTMIIGDGSGTFRVCLENRIPYILIETDIVTLRKNKKKKIALLVARERKMITNASKIIFDSKDHRRYICSKYKYPIKQTIVIHLRPTAENLKFEPLPKLSGKNLVYVGGLVPWSHRRKKRGHRAYYAYFKAFIEAGWKVFIYTARNYKVTPEYLEIGCIDRGKVPQGELYRELSQYTAGLQSYNRIDTPKKSFNYCMLCRPNKLWEYLAAGIPTIGFHGGNGTRIYNGRWGIVIKDLKTETIDNIQLPVIDEKVRQSEVIDNDVGRMRRFLWK